MQVAYSADPSNTCWLDERRHHSAVIREARLLDRVLVLPKSVVAAAPEHEGLPGGNHNGPTLATPMALEVGSRLGGIDQSSKSTPSARNSASTLSSLAAGARTRSTSSSAGLSTFLMS